MLLFAFVECSPGYMRDADTSDCVACPVGTYSDTADASSCTSCPEGTTTGSTGSGTAYLCFGKILFVASLVFSLFQTIITIKQSQQNVKILKPDVSCSPGYGFDFADEECKMCPLGR